MKIKSAFFLGLTLIACSTHAGAQGAEDSAAPAEPASPAPVDVQNGDTQEAGGDLGQFGFGPAFFVVDYKEEVLQDTKDVRVRGDGSISASGSKFSTAVGLAAHYSLAFNSKCRLNGSEIRFAECEKNKGAKRRDIRFPRSSVSTTWTTASTESPRAPSTVTGGAIT